MAHDTSTREGEGGREKESQGREREGEDDSGRERPVKAGSSPYQKEGLAAMKSARGARGEGDWDVRRGREKTGGVRNGERAEGDGEKEEDESDRGAMGDDGGGGCGGQDYNEDKEFEDKISRSKPGAGEGERAGTGTRAEAGEEFATEVKMGSVLHRARLLAMSAEVSRDPIPLTMYAIYILPGFPTKASARRLS
jgi:hypothetical protein